MLRREKAQATSLVLLVVCIALTFFRIDLTSVSLAKGCTIYARALYSFFHTSTFHALVNCWCLISVVFIYDISIASLLLAYIIAATYPFAGTPTIGMSGMCFALLGMICFQVERKVYYHIWWLSFISFGYLAPCIADIVGIDIAMPNNNLHLYCYLVGSLIALLNAPILHERG